MWKEERVCGLSCTFKRGHHDSSATLASCKEMGRGDGEGGARLGVLQL